MKKLFLKLVISVFILFLLFYKIGFLNIYEILSGTNILFLILIIFFYLPIYILGISNLFILFRGIKFKDLIKPYLLSWASSMFVPGKFGELSIFYFLKKKVSFDKSVPVIFIDKIISFFVDLLFVLLGLLFFEAVLNLDSLYNLIIIG